jgi:hypothetical protein
MLNRTTRSYQNLGTTEEGNFLFGSLKESPIMLYEHGNM